MFSFGLHRAFNLVYTEYFQKDEVNFDPNDWFYGISAIAGH